jgi:hypothetical protein
MEQLVSSTSLPFSLSLTHTTCNTIEPFTYAVQIRHFIHATSIFTVERGQTNAQSTITKARRVERRTLPARDATLREEREDPLQLQLTTYCTDIAPAGKLGGSLMLWTDNLPTSLWKGSLGRPY